MDTCGNTVGQPTAAETSSPLPPLRSVLLLASSKCKKKKEKEFHFHPHNHLHSLKIVQTHRYSLDRLIYIQLGSKEVRIPLDSFWRASLDMFHSAEGQFFTDRKKQQAEKNSNLLKGQACVATCKMSMQFLPFL